MKPETSTKEKPIEAHRTKLLLIEGLRRIGIIKKANKIPLIKEAFAVELLILNLKKEFRGILLLYERNVLI